MRDHEAPLLTPWLATFMRVFGQPAIVEHYESELPHRGALFRLRFPPVFGEKTLLGSADQFIRSAALVAHVRAWGFEFDDERVICAAPTPDSFNALLEEATKGQAGYRLTYHCEDSSVTSTGPWLHRYLEGSIPVHVASPSFYESGPARASELVSHLTTLAHDVTVHALNYHLIPRSAIEQLGRRILQVVGGKLTGVDCPGGHAPQTLAWFFDNDLNRYCNEVWFKCTRPEQFGPTFTAPANLAQLHAALEVRLRETLDGVGDVPSGRGDDMRPLTPITFALESTPSGRRGRSLPVVGATRASDDPRLTADEGTVFRDPPSTAAAHLRLEIARVLVRAPTLPVDLPAFGMTLLDIVCDKKVIDLVFGAPDPIARLRVQFPGPATKVEIVELSPPGTKLRRALEQARQRIEAATTAARWEEARRIADDLARAPRDVPPSFLRQLVAGVGATGIVRTGFNCNQDCGMCWQGRDWGRQDPETVLRWIEDLHNAGARSLIISGGEPMLDGRLADYVARARALGIEHVILETNAVLADREGAASALKAAGLTHAFVSLHSPDAAVSDAITRAPGTHARTVRGIRAFLAAGVPVKLNAVLTRQGLEQLPGLPSFVDKEIAEPARFSALMISYPSAPFDAALQGSVVPEPESLRRSLRATIDNALALGFRLEGLDGPCGPPLCSFDADPRVTALRPSSGTVPFRRHVAACQDCAVRGSCLGVHEGQLRIHGEAAITPIRHGSLA